MKKFFVERGKLENFINQKVEQNSWLISGLGLLLLGFSLFVIINNWQAKKQIKQIERVVVAVPFELSRLINAVNIVSATQADQFSSGDTIYNEARKIMWSSKINVIADSLKKMKNLLPIEDQERIIIALSGLSDFEIVQEELNSNWNEIKLKNDSLERVKAINILNERLLSWSALTRDNLVKTLIPLQDKYQISAATEMREINRSISRSTVTILFSVLLTLALVILLKLRQRSLLISKKQAEDANAAKTEFIANVTHELRTPLNGVIGFTDLLSRTKLDDKQQKYSAIIIQSANSLLKIIDDLLSFSKIEAGKLELSISKADLYVIASEVTELMRHPAASKGLKMLLTISPTISRFVQADELRLKQVLLNLLSNAVKFTERGEIELVIEDSSEKLSIEKSGIHFSVRDSGIGIDPKNQQKIFEAFAQADSSTTKRFDGTGLGLTISNKLLALMGSHLSVKSQVGKGSTFSFDIAFPSYDKL